MKTDIYIEFAGNQTDYKLLTDTAKEIWKSDGKKIKDLTSIELYFKPDESNCYYIFNSTDEGSFKV